MSKFKKIFVNILAGLLCVLSLGTMTSCVDIAAVTNVVDEEINIYRDGIDAYVYNGERYVYREEVEELYGHVFWIPKSMYKEAGYAYDAIGRKYEVRTTSRELEENVLLFSGQFYFDMFRQNVYVKESIPFPTNPFEAEYAGFTWSWDVQAERSKETEIRFKLKDIISEEISFHLGEHVPFMGDREKQPQIKYLQCYLYDFHPLYYQWPIALTESKNVYLYREGGWRKVIDEEMEETFLKACFPKYA